MSQQTRPIEYRRCARCGHRVHPERMVKGFGRDCATYLGLIGDTVDTGHAGPDLLDLLAETGTPDSESPASTQLHVRLPP